MLRVTLPCLLLLLSASCGHEAHSVPEGTSMFDGRSLAGWSGDTRYWSVEDGCIVGRSTVEVPLERSIYLFWEGEAQDFEFECEYRIVGGNSGVQYRSVRMPNDDVAGYQADIEDGPSYTGILYESAGRAIMAERGVRLHVRADGSRELLEPLGTADELQKQVRVGEWNTYKISARGKELVHEINGVRMVEVTDEATGLARASGTFALQLHQGPPMEVRYRNLKLRKFATPQLSAAPAQAATPAVAVAAEAEWIWSAGTAEPNERRFFAQSLELSQAATLAGGVIACDNHFIAWMDGVEIARGDDWAAPAAVAKGMELAAGQHWLTLEGWNEGGPAGLAARVMLRGADGTAIRAISDTSWRQGASAPEAWPHIEKIPTEWSAARSFGPVSAHSGPWGAAMAPSVATPAERFSVPPGFVVELMHSAGSGEGSWVSMTFGPEGEIYVSPQQGQLMRLRFPSGPNAPPTVETLDTPAHSAQGLLFANGALYVNVQGGPDGGLQRLRDANHDGTFEEHTVLARYGPPGEHGPHGVVLGPDGLLYFVNGNHTDQPEKIAASSPFQHGAEDVLLERLWDPRGHAVGVMAPGGAVMRVDPTTQRIELIYAGMRNSYDLAFAPNGELFSYDSDMEWDIGASWYRSPRVVHVVPGGENGWRSGSAKWPSAYPDSLPPVLETGPSSPTGTVFGTKGNFPGAWHEALYIADWAYGRIVAVHLDSAGASYTASEENFVTGKPMNVADLEFGPDGALWFITGGRGTQSGLYRVRWVGGTTPPPAQGTFERQDPALKLRKQLEDLACPQALALSSLGHADRFVRYAARLALERKPIAEWQAAVRTATSPLARAEGWLARARVDAEASAPELAEQIAGLDFSAATSEIRWLALRSAMLTWMRAPNHHETQRALLTAPVSAWLPSGDALLDREISALLVAMNAPGLPPRFMEKFRSSAYNEEKLHYALLLRLVESGWTRDLRVEYLNWVRAARGLPGGFSLAGFYEAIEREAFARMSESEAEAVRAILPPVATVAQYAPAEPRAFVRAWTTTEAAAALEVAGAPDLARGERLFEAVGCVQCHRVNGKGGSVGPDLSAVGSRFGRRDLLEAILEPQKVVSDQYPLAPMPIGLANTLQAAELRDLISWLEDRVAQ